MKTTDLIWIFTAVMAVFVVMGTGCKSGVDEQTSYVTTPDVTGMTLPKAKAAILAAGLVEGETSYDYHETVSPGLVIGQTPEPNSRVKVGSRVNIRLSAGPKPEMTGVPDLTGLSAQEAEALLAKMGLTVGNTVEEWHGSVPIGSVIRQEPAAGNVIPQGTAVDFWISAYVPFGGSGYFTELVWNEEFNDTSDAMPRSADWKFDVGFYGNADKSDYCFRGRRKENCYIQDGVLCLKVTNEKYYYAAGSVWRTYSSGSIRTQDLHYWTLGRFETRAKLPPANGTWPAIWMGAQVRDQTGYGAWPNWGEIDILESYGKKPGYLTFSLHTNLYYSGTGSQYSGNYNAGNVIYDDFHIYAVEWFPDRIDWYYDNMLVHTAKKHDPAKRPDSAEGSGVEEWRYWPFDKPFFFWLSLAYARPQDELTPQDIAMLPQVFEVDYVRVYQSSVYPCTKYP